MLSPKLYMQTTLNGVSVWAINVLPALFPFFIVTRLLVGLSVDNVKLLDKFCNKFFKTKNSGKIFLLSIISGYPIGAKLICSAYSNGQMSSADAKKMMSYCSLAGPMFLLGSVGVAIFNSTKIGYILILSTILGGIVNGIIYRNSYKSPKQDFLPKTPNATSNNLLADTMLDSIMSILLVGGYIVFSFVLIALLNDLGIMQALASLLCKILPVKEDIIIAFFNGCIEMTGGVLSLSKLAISPILKITLSAFLLSFGGVSIFLQSLNFSKELKIKKSLILLQKFTQGIWTSLFAFIIYLIVF